VRGLLKNLPQIDVTLMRWIQPQAALPVEWTTTTGRSADNVAARPEFDHQNAP
jgi:hypothetical protein